MSATHQRERSEFHSHADILSDPLEYVAFRGPLQASCESLDPVANHTHASMCAANMIPKTVPMMPRYGVMSKESSHFFSSRCNLASRSSLPL